MPGKVEVAGIIFLGEEKTEFVFAERLKKKSSNQLISFFTKNEEGMNLDFIVRNLHQKEGFPDSDSC